MLVSLFQAGEAATGITIVLGAMGDFLCLLMYILGMRFWVRREERKTL